MLFFGTTKTRDKNNKFLQKREILSFAGDQLMIWECCCTLQIRSKAHLFSFFESPSADFECTNEPLTTTPTDNAPATSKFQQKVLGYAVGYTSVYEHFPLPDSLTKVRSDFLDKKMSGLTENDFLLQFLNTIRKDVWDIDRYLSDVFRKQNVLRPWGELSQQEKDHFSTKENCDLCHIRFGSVTTSKKTGVSYHVRKVRQEGLDWNIFFATFLDP